MKNLITKMSTLLLMIVLTISLAACGSKHEAVKLDKDSTKLVQDKNYTQDLKKEKEVEDGQIYLQNNTVICAMVIKDGIKESDAKTLLNNYAKELKKAYKNMPVHAIAVQKGKKLGEITLK